MMAIRCLAGGGILLVWSLLREPADRRPSARQWGGASGGRPVPVRRLPRAAGARGAVRAVGRVCPCLATIPLFVPLLAWLLTNSGRPTTRTMVALMAAFGGVALLVGAQGMRPRAACRRATPDCC